MLGTKGGFLLDQPGEVGHDWAERGESGRMSLDERVSSDHVTVMATS